MSFDWKFMTLEDRLIMAGFLGHKRRLIGYDRDYALQPDLIIAPDGIAYLYRWHIIRTPEASVYFHIQVKSDPERPLHDHPWDNTTTVLSGGYDEIWCPSQGGSTRLRSLRKGDTVHRKATEAHRLILPPDIPYTMTLFSCGPKVREWGFYYPDGWKPYTEVTEMRDGVSVHKRRT